MSGNDEGGEPPTRKIRLGERTIKDSVKAQALADRVKRDVALEKAEKVLDEVAESLSTEQITVSPIVTVGSDGVPQVGLDQSEVPTDVHWELVDDEAPSTRKP